jgi:hypothetical protein
VDAKTKRILIIAAAIVAAVLASVIAMSALGGGTKSATKTEYQTTIVNVRDRVDFAYADITKADSVENLIERLDLAGARIEAASGDVSDAAVAEGFEKLNDDLADALGRFGGSLQATADQFRDPSSAGFGLENINSLGFEEWDEVNEILTSMQEKGLEVELLERH